MGDSEYVFKHALTQEVSYNSLLQEQRRQIHGQTGEALEKLNAPSIDDHLDELASSLQPQRKLRWQGAPTITSAPDSARFRKLRVRRGGCGTLHRRPGIT